MPTKKNRLTRKSKDNITSIVFLAIILIPGKMAAQSVEKPFLRFGFQAGINLSNMNFNAGEPPPQVKAEPSWKAGFSVGLQLRFLLTSKLILQPEYAFNERNSSDKGQATDYSIDYFSLPVLLVYQVSPRLGILGGPQFEILVDAREKDTNGETNVTHSIEERGIGIVGGLEFAVYKDFFVSARYLQGLNHVGLRQGTSDQKEFKYQSFILTAGIRF